MPLSAPIAALYINVIATLTTHNDIAGNTFTATLSGKSVDLLGHYYEAVDTITGSIMSENITSNNNESLYHFYVPAI